MSFSSAPGATIWKTVQEIMVAKPLDKIIGQPTTKSMNIMMEQMANIFAAVKKQHGEENMDPWRLSLTRTTKKRHKRRGANNWTTRKNGARKWINNGFFNPIWNADPTRNTKSEETGLQTEGGGDRHWGGTNCGVHGRTICGRVKRRVLLILKQLHMHHACTPRNDVVQGTQKR